jgi:SAM-dependent methyltransferase
MEETRFGKKFWESKWKNGETGWDIGEISPPLKLYIDQLKNHDQRILIPGCGKCYEAEYLHEKGFKNVHTLDLSTCALEKFQDANPNFPKEHIHNEDFFDHDVEYDLILEQTFFCALDPSQRRDYVHKMYDLLIPKGKLVGLLFDDPLSKDRPPFGGSKHEYLNLFSHKFTVDLMETAHNSILPRRGRELFFICTKPLE